MPEIRIRRRNQFTLPAAIVTAAGLVVGDRLIVSIDPADPDTILFRRHRPSTPTLPGRGPQ